MTEPSASVVYVLPDKMGGVTNVIGQLLAHRVPDGLAYHVVMTRNRFDADARASRVLAADSQQVIDYALPSENLHTVMRRLARAVPPGGGVYVASDLLDLATASVHDFGRAVVLLLHGDTEYYYDLAVRHAPVVHAFIAASRQMHRELVARLPHRADAIHLLPYGVTIPEAVRRPSAGPLRAIFAGRLEHGQKGVFDLPLIDRALAERGVRVDWTIAGDGPDAVALRTEWAFNPHVCWTGPLDAAALAARYAEADVFVLPTRYEGFPVALLEAMAAGLVPVVSNIPSGVPDVVTPGQCGELPPVGDVAAFAVAIDALHRDRLRLERMSAAARAEVSARFDIRDRAGAYQALYARWRDLYRPAASREHLQYGSRLDRPWIPNTFVKAVRALSRRSAAR